MRRSRVFVLGLGLAAALVLGAAGVPGRASASGPRAATTTGPSDSSPAVALAAGPSGGWWLAHSDGGVTAGGSAGYLGSAGALHLAAALVGVFGTADRGGYWLLGRDGGIFTFGDAGFLGSTGAMHLNRPIVGMTPTPDGRGYWLVASDGGIFTFGDAAFLGSAAGSAPAPVVGMAPTTDGAGYWLASTDGTVLAYGSAAGSGPTGAAGGNGAVSLPPTPAGMRALPAGRLYGVTVDDIDLGSSAPVAAAAFGRMPTTRVVFDLGEPASYYADYLRQLQPHSYILGELLDSSDTQSTNLAAEHARVASYLATLGNLVDIWEIGNEVNGNWTGPYTTGAAMVTDAYDQVAAAGKRSALTVFYNAGCGNGPGEPDPATYAQTYLPDRVRQGVDYVLASYYQTQCNNIAPSAATFTAFFQQMRSVFPAAAEGFGEIGLPDAVTAATQSQALSIIAYYYDLAIDLPYYVGGHFWWYYAEDALPQPGNAIWTAINAAILAEG